MGQMRTFDEFTDQYFRDHPEEIDDYLAEIFQEFAEDNDAGALLVFLLVLALCSIKLSSDGADTGITVCSGA
jgi:HTH-type transcriptional regulator / antitoxin HigA